MTSATPAIDPWIASSLLQKAIRRGEADLAIHAARTLHRQRGKGIWRRLITIAYEDIGIADLGLVQQVTLLGVDRQRREALGAEVDTIVDLSRRLAETPKDRSTDYLACAAIQHPEYEHQRGEVALLTVRDQIDLAVDPNTPVIHRAIAAWYSSGVNGGGQRVLGPGDLPELLYAFGVIGLPGSLRNAIEIAARVTGEPIVIMLSLLWALLRDDDQAPRTEQVCLPDTPLCRSMPTWAFDKHTSIGKRAIAQLVRENSAVDAVFAQYVPDFRARDVALMAAFYVDAVPVARRLTWSRSSEFEALGLETDMMKVGCPREGIAPILEAVRSNLDHLNAIRCRLFGGQAKSRGAA